MSSKLSERYEKESSTKKTSVNTNPFKVISFLENKKNYYILIYSKHSLILSILYSTDPEDWILVISLGGKCPCTLSHLGSSTNSFSKNSHPLCRVPHLKMSTFTSQLERHQDLNKDETPAWSWELALVMETDPVSISHIITFVSSQILCYRNVQIAYLDYNNNHSHCSVS